MSKTIKKRFDILVNEEEEKISESFELDKDVSSVKGIMMSSDRDDLLYFRGSQKIVVSGEEIFPEDYESRLLMCGVNVPPTGRYYDTGNLAAGNGIIKVEYKDNPNALTTFSPYRVSLYVDCVID